MNKIWNIILVTTLLTCVSTDEIQSVVTENLSLINETKAKVNTTLETSTSIILPTTDSPLSLSSSTASALNLTTATTETFSTTFNPLDYNDNKTTFASTTTTATGDNTTSLDPYCTPSLCELFNGTHIQVLPNIACHNNGNFAPTCGTQPHLLYMSERRRNLILDLHNLARSRVASGQVLGYERASHMPQLKWDSELEYMATLHAKRCKFTHDLCRNTPRFEFSGQNIGYYWIRREIKSHSRRMKNFIVNWFKEHLDANQTFMDVYQPHPEGKKIGHFTLMVSDRVHRIGCAAIRYREPDQMSDTKFLLTCNYDYTNILGEPIYQKGATASKCFYKTSKKYAALCDWKEAIYEYDIEEIEDDEQVLHNDI